MSLAIQIGLTSRSTSTSLTYIKLENINLEASLQSHIMEDIYLHMESILSTTKGISCLSNARLLQQFTQLVTLATEHPGPDPSRPGDLTQDQDQDMVTREGTSRGQGIKQLQEDQVHEVVMEVEDQGGRCAIQTLRRQQADPVLVEITDLTATNKGQDIHQTRGEGSLGLTLIQVETMEDAKSWNIPSFIYL